MRKRNAVLVFYIVFAAILAGAASSALAQEPTRKVLYSLEPDEAIMRAESFMGLAVDSTDLILVLAKGKGTQNSYMVFRDGAKKGPFPQLKDAMDAAYSNKKNLSQRKRDCATYTPGSAPEGIRPASVQTKGGQALQFKGVTFAQHLMIFTNQVTPDGALAYATAADNDKAWFECSDGRKISFGGLPESFKFSPDGKNAAVLVKGRYSLNEINNLAKLPPEKMAEAFKEADKKYLYTIDGKKYGPFDRFEEYSFWYPKTSNDLYFRVGDQIFRNGSPMLTSESFDPCNFYPNADGKSYAMFTYESVLFSDGKKYPSPLDVLTFQDKGKTVFKWLALENAKDLVVYQRTF
jgi:hypothetical protein